MIEICGGPIKRLPLQKNTVMDVKETGQKGYNARVLALALPAIVSNITVPLLGLCDTAISGHLGSPLFLAAISAGAMMLNVVFFLCGFLRMGTTGLTAEAFGAGNVVQLRQTFSRSLWLAAAIGLAVVVLSWPLCRLLQFVIGADPQVSALSRSYFMICIFGAPAQLGVMALSGWMVGMQSTVRPMIVAISINVVNILLSLLAVFPFGLGFPGVAVGSLCANWFGVALALILAAGLWKKSAPEREGLRSLLLGPKRVWRGGEMKRFFKVNSDLFLRSACVMGVSLGVTSIGARLGSDALALNAVLMQFFVFFSYFMDGFAFAAEALCGKAYGSRSRSSLYAAVRSLLGWSAIMALAFFLLYLFAGDAVVGLLTSEESVRHDATLMRIFILLLPPVSVAAFIFDGFYIGLIATRRMLLATFLALLAFFGIAFIPPGVLSGTQTWLGLSGNQTLWTAFLSYLFVRGAYLIAAFPSTVKSRFSK